MNTTTLDHSDIASAPSGFDWQRPMFADLLKRWRMALVVGHCRHARELQRTLAVLREQYPDTYAFMVIEARKVVSSRPT